MSEMIERIARVIYEKSPYPEGVWEELREDGREIYRGISREVTAVMRDWVWRAMIDEALK